MCKNWSEDGSCSYGDKCSFAHGEEQIRGSKEMKVSIVWLWLRGFIDPIPHRNLTIQNDYI